MNKISLIIQREFLFRVRKRSFLIVTLLVPLAFAAIMIIPALLASSSGSQKVVVVDKSGFFKGQFRDAKDVYFKFLDNTPLDSIKKNYAKEGYSGVLLIPQIDIERPSGFEYYSEAQASIMLENALTSNLNSAIEKLRMEANGIDKSKLDAIHADVTVDFRNSKDEKKGSSAASFVLGYASGFIIYLMLLLFGTSVMRGVMEEKVNRIAEVMVSSVRPFQLMLGKIIGIAAVGLLQFIIWAILLIGLSMVLPLFLSPDAMHAASQSSNNPQMAEAMQKVSFMMAKINWPLFIGCFLFYFLGGYLFYSSLFAAVGSLANEDASDVQQMTLPVTAPIIISFLIVIKAVADPTSSLAVWASIIPFSSPLVMMARLPAGVPGTVAIWQLLLSMVLLVAGFIFTTWMSGRIYRTGILMYGKKITLKEAIKWIFSKS
ncbi:ABC-2 type transport system permease protein [Chitinophaga dinghuensis]|uniref:ABC-2 type transport system permease protein n=1 Tax=Chitinophaga dinghuensis TaxID=1539050 RepID=A0A327VKV1_9BACT|nr:ABC transporter permease [Chitinophaga dinghuensis]RAJ75122.1 ABC-2 type transport system permease protein [Chitinophaga dinghuensis]